MLRGANYVGQTNADDDGARRSPITRIPSPWALAGRSVAGLPADRVTRTSEIAERQLAHFKKLHPDYEAGVRRELANMTRAKASETAQQQKMPQGVEAAE